MGESICNSVKTALSLVAKYTVRLAVVQLSESIQRARALHANALVARIMVCRYVYTYVCVYRIRTHTGTR